MKKSEEAFNKLFPGKMVNAFQKGRILEYGDFLLEWSAEQCESGIKKCPDGERCHRVDAEKIREGQSLNG